MAANRTGKIQNLINYRMRVTLNDGRQMTGQMLAYDKHMNLVLADCEEFRRVRKKNAKATTAPGASAPPLVESEEKRTLGLAIVRGANIISLSVDGPPPADPAARLGAQSGAPAGVPAAMQAGTGISKPAGRGMPSGLTGPAAGVGGFSGFGAPGGPPGFGRGGPPGGPPGFPPQGFQGGPPGFQGGGFQPPQGGRGGPPPGFGGR